MTSHWEWQFGGGLEGLPSWVAWSLITAAGLGGIWLIIHLYKRTFQELPPWKRRLLGGLRMALLLALLVCLANPSRINSPDHETKKQRRLAVMLDCSDSMTAMDNRSESRLGNALHLWRQHAGEIETDFNKTEYFRFDSVLLKQQTLDAAAQPGNSGTETRFYEALNHVVDSEPDAIVCLTDGLDTTNETAAAIAAHAQKQHIPLYFVPGQNRGSPQEMLDIREVNTPAHVLCNSKFQAGAVFGITASKAYEVPAELWTGNTKLAEIKIKVHPGFNLVPWTTEISAGERGPVPVEFRLGASGSTQQSSVATTQVVEKEKIHILYCQGALQWGHSFLLSALKSDPSFTIASLANPWAGQKDSQGISEGQVRSSLPDRSDDLKKYSLVIMAQVYADQLSISQQQSLVDYTKSGGAVLFIAPDNSSSVQFSGSLIEQMLPIVFEPPLPSSPNESAEAAFQTKMESLMGANAFAETQFANEAIPRTVIAKLTPFALPEGTSQSKFFKPGPNAPQFAEYAKIQRVKPGAEVLAVHPSDRLPGTNSPRVLAARQQFGKGFAAALTTDLLWRWKMSLASSNHSAEIFWQQFTLALSGGQIIQALHLIKPNEEGFTSHPVKIQIKGSFEDGPLTIVSISPSGGRQKLHMTTASNPAALSMQAAFIPDADGRWQVEASDSKGNLARITLRISTQAQKTEAINIPADLEGLRSLSEATGGALIGEDFKTLQIRSAESSLHPLRISHPIWNAPWCVLFLLGVYAAELATRRLFKLL